MSTFEFATLRVGKHRAGPSGWFGGMLYRERFTLALITLTAAALVAMAAGANHQADLTGPGTSKVVNGAFIAHVPSGDVSGTGLFDPYLRVQAGGIQNGFNTDAPSSGPPANRAKYFNSQPPYNANDPKTVSINLARVPVVPCEGVPGFCRETFLDMNEAGNSPFLSLDTMDVYLATTPPPTTSNGRTGPSRTPLPPRCGVSRATP